MVEGLGFDQFLAKFADLAPKGFGVALHVRFLSPAFMVQTYDPEWVEIYSRDGLVHADPVLFWSFAYDGAARWSEVDIPDPRNVFGQARAFGINYGCIVSAGPTGSRSVGGFAREDREYRDSEIELLSRLVSELHESAAPPDSLTDAQRMALRLIAGGARHAEASARLGISESALKARLKSARERLFVRTTAEAIQRAQEYNLI